MGDSIKEYSSAPPDHSSEEDLRKLRDAEKIRVSLSAHKAPLQLLDGIQRFKLKEIVSATNNFSHENLITESALGKVYGGRLLRDGNLMNFTVRRLNCIYGQGDESQTEISTLKSLKHENIISIFGHCDDNNENIIIYEQAFNGTLDQHIRDSTLTWSQILQICLGVARALNHIHCDIIHCDINSSKIFLNEDWEPKIYGFELSTKYPQSWRHSLLYSCYFSTSNMTPKYDVYSFGVLLFEVLCGMKPMIGNDGILEELIYPNLRKHVDIESLRQIKDLAYKCLNQQPLNRPTMDQIVEDLEQVLELQKKDANLEHLKAVDEAKTSNKLMIPLSEIRFATDNFHKKYEVGDGGYGVVYKVDLDVLNIQSVSLVEGMCKDEIPKVRKTVAIKRMLRREDAQDKQGFLTELKLIISCKHRNMVSLLGYSREANEMILVFEYASNGSLHDFLANKDKKVNLTWVQRLQICRDIANGINYIHINMEGKPKIIHRDIKSDNILLDENLNSKLADFGLSKFNLMKQSAASTVVTANIAGTKFYIDPEYKASNKYNRLSDVYSFGVVLFEILSGTLAYNTIYVGRNDEGIASVARRRYKEGSLKELIDPKMMEEDNDHIFTLFDLIKILLTHFQKLHMQKLKQSVQQ